jgi:hypothetical protein
MPVILEQQDWPVCLGEAEGDYAALLGAAPRMDCCGCSRSISALAHRATLIGRWTRGGNVEGQRQSLRGARGRRRA